MRDFINKAVSKGFGFKIHGFYFDDFRNRIAEQLEVSITHITEKLNEKIIEIRKQTDQSDKELNNLIVRYHLQER